MKGTLTLEFRENKEMPHETELDKRHKKDADENDAEKEEEATDE